MTAITYTLQLAALRSHLRDNPERTCSCAATLCGVDIAEVADYAHFDALLEGVTQKRPVMRCVADLAAYGETLGRCDDAGAAHDLALSANLGRDLAALAADIEEPFAVPHDFSIEDKSCAGSEVALGNPWMEVW